MNRYPLWKFAVLIVAIVLGTLYALPNLFGEDPAVQVTIERAEDTPDNVQQRALALLEESGVAVVTSQIEGDSVLFRLESDDDQLSAADTLRGEFGTGYTVALNLAPATPAWLTALHAQPMYLGLDLRGGVHFLMQVDMDEAVTQHMDGLATDFRNQLRQERIRFSSIEQDADDRQVVIRFRNAPEREQALGIFRENVRTIEPAMRPSFSQEERDGDFWLIAEVSDDAVSDIRSTALQQNMATLRNRVNQLGVAEPVIQRQGSDRIVVQLPGVQDTARAKAIIGATATLEFRMVHEDNDTWQGSGGSVPSDALRYETRDGQPIILERDVMLTGDTIRRAQSGLDSETNRPQVNITLRSDAGNRFNEATRQNVGRPMATVFIETRNEPQEVNGEIENVRVRTEEVINVANILEPLHTQFRITGLSSTSEARDLSLLLSAGSLRAPMDIIEERTVGPSLGQENIDQGLMAVTLGFLLVVAFMAFYYKVFGLIANMALFLNLVFIVAVLSLLQATLTLPGIAGIVLTVGMAVDANVLIFQRIREELFAGMKPREAIHAGYAKALSTIADANITTLLAALVLFIFGTGPIRGFAVTLSIGIASSMFTAIVGTRAVVYLLYERKSRLKHLPI
ncbi:preprotein translocase subunit SecD [Natronocella acetinitrilica]|uniref:Protein translocase subunit SecD n=1 Tax=Natronocella acetinitrilica TaxID=414046 RepID=A0AAE3G780_9GAMM|nr:protein translocase subunit SecD [Natronocella acetinitrilica]MCP1676334.1 preprotein translocase subunit SecD [Natronocella acetinitrilica]